MKILPYVYKCTHRITGQFYIGFRCGNKVESAQDIFKYRTSSKLVQETFDDFDVVILAEFFDKVDAYDFEQQLIWEDWKNPLILNKSCFHNGARFSTAGKTGYHRSEETKKKISKSRYRSVTDEWRQQARNRRLGTSHSSETKQKIRQSQAGRNHQTPESKENLRLINLGSRWYTNGEVNVKSKKPIEGFVLGRTIVK